MPFLFTLPLSLLIFPLYIHFALSLFLSLSFSLSFCLSLHITVSDSGLTSWVVRGGCCTDGLNRGVSPWVQVCWGLEEEEIMQPPLLPGRQWTYNKNTTASAALKDNLSLKLHNIDLLWKNNLVIWDLGTWRCCYNKVQWSKIRSHSQGAFQFT